MLQLWLYCSYEGTGEELVFLITCRFNPEFCVCYFFVLGFGNVLLGNLTLNHLKIFLIKALSEKPSTQCNVGAYNRAKGVRVKVRVSLKIYFSDYRIRVQRLGLVGLGSCWFTTLRAEFGF